MAKDNWIPLLPNTSASNYVPVSTAEKIAKLLVVVQKPDGERYWTEGWFFGAPLFEWRILGSPSDFSPFITHWQEPKLPCLTRKAPRESKAEREARHEETHRIIARAAKRAGRAS